MAGSKNSGRGVAMPYYQKNTLDRIEKMFWRLQTSYYRQIADLEVTAYVTKEPVPYAERFSGEEKKLEIGAVWGELFDCAWFHFTGKLPEGYDPADCSLIIDISGEGLCVDENGNPLIGITNGSAIFEAGSTRKRSVPLKYLNVKDGYVDMWMDAGCNGLFGDYASGALREANISMRLEELRSLYYDYFVLKETMEQLSEKTARYHCIQRALNKVCNIMDEYTEEEAVQARAVLKSEMEKSGGDASLTITGIGHAHIDLAWLWPIRETIRKGARTFATVDKLMDIYPEYRFGFSQPQLLFWMKLYYPDLYTRLQKRVKEGKIECQGAMWVECDTNITGEEALVRQIMQGARFWKDEFDFDIDNIWLPDVFGYSAALPQIMEKSGLKYFMTQKLSWSEHNQFPHHTFNWVGIDGTSVLVHMLPEETYNSLAGPAALHRAEEKFLDKGVSDEALMLFGVGDGGGGPGAIHLEKLARLHDVNGLPRCRQGFAKDLFAGIDHDRDEYATWNGELYLEFHRGTYTTHARNKKFNRKMEQLLRELEYAASLAYVYAGKDYPTQLLDETWKEVLLYQFHDIIPGSSIKRVYDESLARYEILVEKIQDAIQEYYAAVYDGEYAINSLNFARTEYVQKDDTWYKAELPAMGAAKLLALTAADQDVTAKDGVLENEKLIVKFGENGEIVSIFDKEAQKETLEEAANKFKLYDDTDGDAWDIRIYYMEKNPKTMQLISSKFYVDGPNAAAEQTFEFGKSVLTQKVILQKNSDYVTFDTTVDWKETEKMLRTDFATCIHTDEVTCNIQYGSLKRPTHRNTSWEMTKFEVCAHKWIDLSRDDYGVALLNDCKYGYAVLENRMDINLLRSTMSPGVDADKAVHTFRYAYYPHRGNEKHALVEQKAIAFNILPVLTNGHNAAALPESFLQTDCTNVEITAVKKAEDSDRLVVRMYQTDGTESICCVTLPARVKKVSFCDLMEREAEEVPVENGAVVLKFKPFEIHTILVEM